jgi:hypothetical protein
LSGFWAQELLHEFFCQVLRATDEESLWLSGTAQELLCESFVKFLDLHMKNDFDCLEIKAQDLGL